MPYGPAALSGVTFEKAKNFAPVEPALRAGWNLHGVQVPPNGQGGKIEANRSALLPVYAG